MNDQTMTIYRGKAAADHSVRVHVGAATRALPPCLKLMNHSPTGFCWGYEGSGPAQLALAILMDFTANRERALRLYQDFKREVIAPLPMQDDFELPGTKVAEWLSTHP